MSRTSASALRDGIILNNRYRILKQIGQGGFGRAYLAEDTHRYRELCVLKEFAPTIESDRELRKAEDLFEREAGILYKLKHLQIPQFEALLRTRVDDRRSLFLVQEYIAGESYWQLLKRRGKLTEAEVIDMVRELLPVLDHIHRSKLIHRDISPDNLIRRDIDGKTALIDFGCVKIAANAVSRSTGNSVTLIGKKGYSPDEQISRGQAFPCSDLYSLAATAIVLLTGKQPDELYDSHAGKWDWESQAKVSSNFKKILNKMLAYKPCDRYQSAEEIIKILDKEPNFAANSFISRIRTLILAPGREDSSDARESDRQAYSSSNRHQSSNISKQITRIPSAADFKRVTPWQWGLITAAVFLIPGLISFGVIKNYISTPMAFDFDLGSDSSLSETERDLQQQIYRRVESLNLDAGAFYDRVDSIFHEQYPELRGVQLTEKPEHQNYREIWYEIASDLLDRQERTR